MELEVYKKSDFYEDYIDSQKEYYERANADAYFAERIAEKDKVIARNKFKRCRANAKWCDAEVYHIRRTPLGDMSEHEYWQYENDFWQRWQKRWLDLAEQFKGSR